MKTTLIAIGRMRPGSLHDLYQEYCKRISPPPELKELSLPGKGNDRAREAALLLEAIPRKDCFVVALDERGESLATGDLAARLQKSALQGRAPVFVIGGADGLDDSVRQRADLLLSFGHQTWPHMLVRVMLAEQLYRMQQILAGHPYHRA